MQTPICVPKQALYSRVRDVSGTRAASWKARVRRRGGETVPRSGRPQTGGFRACAVTAGRLRRAGGSGLPEIQSRCTCYDHSFGKRCSQAPSAPSARKEAALLRPVPRRTLRQLRPPRGRPRTPSPRPLAATRQHCRPRRAPGSSSAPCPGQDNRLLIISGFLICKLKRPTL